MHRITSTQLRSRYLEFFEARGHVTIPSASLVPNNDPTVLFTTAGMHPLVPYLLGEPHPSGRRLTNVQRCIRTGDIDVIGDDTHLTMFEMLGNWSLGDYTREDAISWSFEFLTSVLGIPIDRLGVTCFAGDHEVPPDHESVAIWTGLGIPPQRIAHLGRDDNWWGPAGRTGPCGPDTEIFYWVGPEPVPSTIDVSDRRWVEIWNNVFMGYTKTAAGDHVPLASLNVDTGMGLERTLVALNGFHSVYEVDTVRPLVDTLRGLSHGRAEHERELRIVTDHLRASCFLVSDGVEPSNKDRGYVLRRLIRRCVVFARRLGLPVDWHHRAVASLDVFGDVYQLDHDRIVRILSEEMVRFDRTLAHGLRVLEKLPVLDGKIAFDLFQTYGFPFELTRELALASGKHVDDEGFQAELELHRERSRLPTSDSFTGGLADHTDEVVRYHTLTHLLQAALREVLGSHVIQRGSNITRERLRFDFSHEGKPTPEELGRVQALVDDWLHRDLVVQRGMMTEGEARALGAIGAFGEKYGETVSVYAIVDGATGEVISREFCGGPHVTASSELGDRAMRFRIVKEQAISAGIRRIKAVLERRE